MNKVKFGHCFICERTYDSNIKSSAEHIFPKSIYYGEKYKILEYEPSIFNRIIMLNRRASGEIIENNTCYDCNNKTSSDDSNVKDLYDCAFELLNSSKQSNKSKNKVISYSKIYISILSKILGSFPESPSIMVTKNDFVKVSRDCVLNKKINRQLKMYLFPYTRKLNPEILFEYAYLSTHGDVRMVYMYKFYPFCFLFELTMSDFSTVSDYSKLGGINLSKYALADFDFIEILNNANFLDYFKGTKKILDRELYTQQLTFINNSNYPEAYLVRNNYALTIGGNAAKSRKFELIRIRTEKINFKKYNSDDVKYIINENGLINKLNANGNKMAIEKDEITYIQGHKCVIFKNTKHSYTRLVHRIVATKFIKKHNFTDIIFIDYNKNNFRAENLEWVSRNEKKEHVRKQQNLEN